MFGKMSLRIGHLPTHIVEEFLDERRGGPEVQSSAPERLR